MGTEEVQTAKGRFPEERRDHQDAEQELNQVRVEKETRLFSFLGTIMDSCFTRVSRAGFGLWCVSEEIGKKKANCHPLSLIVAWTHTRQP